MDRCSAHIQRILAEIPADRFLYDQRLDGFGTGDALIEIACDLGVDFTDPAVQRHQMFLEIGNSDDRNRNQSSDIHCQPGIDAQHDGKDKQQIGAVPDNVHQAPCHQFTDLAGITHDPGMDIADIVLIEIGK